MKERDGRFLFPAPRAELRMTADGLSCGKIMIVAKVHGGFVPNPALPTVELQERSQKIASLLAEGRNAEAVFLANVIDWRSSLSGKTARPFNKSGYNPSERRDERGRWSTVEAQAPGAARQNLHFTPVASADDPRANKMAKDAATAAGLNRAQRRRLHDLITGQGINDFQEILRIAKEIASGGA